MLVETAMAASRVLGRGPHRQAQPMSTFGSIPAKGRCNAILGTQGGSTFHATCSRCNPAAPDECGRTPEHTLKSL